jgi:acid phosphatase type 7
MNKTLKILLALMLTLTFTLQAAKGKKKKAPKGKTDIVKLTNKLTPMKGTTPAQWRVLWTGNAASEATISWSTAEIGKTHKVYFGETTKLGNEVNCQRNGEYSRHKDEIEKVSAAFYHHASLKDLKPSTKYFFVMESDGVKSKQLYFITAPESGTDFSIIHGGDSRNGHSTRCQINVMMSVMIKEKPAIIAFAHGGDYIASGKSWKQWRLWLSHNELTNGEDGRVLPIIPTRGNHDGGPLYKEIFNIDPKQPDWHTTNIGKDVALVTLDTNVSGGGDQKKWLEGELKRLRPKSTWLLTQYHRPLYPAVKGPPRHTKIFCPVFDMYKVDLALESDGHCIKRTIPIKNNKPDPTGTVYVGEGGLGVGQRKPKAGLWYLKGGVAGSQHHVMVLDFKKSSLRIQTVLLSGEIFDDHTLKVR